jgi:hypothetical protein
MNKDLEAQIGAAVKAALSANADAAELDRKMKGCCAKSPPARGSEAMEKAMMK